MRDATVPVEDLRAAGFDAEVESDRFGAGRAACAYASQQTGVASPKPAPSRALPPPAAGFTGFFPVPTGISNSVCTAKKAMNYLAPNLNI